MKATVLAERWPLKRFEMFREGLQHIGYQVDHRPEVTDLLVIWNRYRDGAELADRFDDEGKPVIVAENAYIPEDGAGRRYTALALDGHNGSGRIHVGGKERWERMEVELRPWRDGGEWILLCSQRGIGAPGMAMPPLFFEIARRWILDFPQNHHFHIEERKPPSRDTSQAELAGLWCKLQAVVVWTSNMATEALIQGIPAVYLGPHHIMEGACGSLRHLPNPDKPDREKAFQRLAWAQWTKEEIQHGHPFAWLLSSLSGEKPDA